MNRSLKVSKMGLNLNSNNGLFGKYRYLNSRSESGRFGIVFSGFTLIEILIAIAIIGTLAAIAVPSYMSYRENARITAAISDIKTIEAKIERFWFNNKTFPDQLSDLKGGPFEDPWGNPYAYLPVEGASIGQLRKDHNMVPVNSDYDLYSKGKDGQSATPFTSNNSQDDIVRARDGAFVGLVSDY